MLNPRARRRAIRRAIDSMENVSIITPASVAEYALWLLPEQLRFGAREPLRRTAVKVLARLYGPLRQ